MLDAGDLLRLHSLFSAIVEREVGGELPLPAELRSAVGGAGFDAPDQQKAERWLTLLDMCLSPALFRTGVQKECPDEQTTRAAIRYLAGKERHSEADRDRLDWLLTWVFKSEEAQGAAPAFSAIRSRIAGWLQGLPRLPLSDAAQDLLSELAAALQETGDLRSFDQLAESRLIQRARELKENLKGEFFHQDVLPAIVNYNVLFGRRFDELFSEAARQTRDLAATVREKDYRTTGGDFRRLSEAVKRERRAAQPAPDGAAPAAPAQAAAPTPEPAHAALPQDPAERMKALGVDTFAQESELKKMVSEIAAFVHSAGRPVRAIPMPHGNLVVADWESTAFHAEYAPAETSFRAEFARALQKAVACMARINEEMALYQEKRASTEFLWKTHYDALVFLLYFGRRHVERLEKMAADARARGLPEKAGNLAKTAEKLRGHVHRAASAL